MAVLSEVSRFVPPVRREGKGLAVVHDGCS